MTSIDLVVDVTWHDNGNISMRVRGMPQVWVKEADTFWDAEEILNILLYEELHYLYGNKLGRYTISYR